jgi:hypothetical protein
MNKIKEIFEDYIVIPHGPVDPYGLANPNGPWIVGSFALWKYLKEVCNVDVDWVYDDIDYVVNTEEQGNELLNYFRNAGEPETLLYEGIYKFSKAQVNIKLYEDIRFRLHVHDIDVCQVGTDNKNFYLSKSAYTSIHNNQCKATGLTFDQQRTDSRIQKYTKRGFVFQT